ncbi:hypothetical protein CLOM_g13422, partial [Closterium sp. NIES-68]
LGQIEACWNKDFEDLLEQTPPGQQIKFPAFCPEIPEELEMTRIVPAQCADAVLEMKKYKQEQGEWPDSLLVEIPDTASPKEWSGQLFRLQNVFVNSRGQAFNQTHLFNAGRCSDGLADFDYPPGTRFASLPSLLNLLSAARSPSDVVFSEMAEKLPLFLSLAPAMRLLRNTPVAVQNRKLVRGIWQSVVGLRLAGSAIHTMAYDSLLFARTLYMPLFQPCGQPSPSLLRAFRSRHLFLPSGLPLVSQEGAYQSHGTRETGEDGPGGEGRGEGGGEGRGGGDIAEEGAAGRVGVGRLRHDWVVVVAAPPARLPTVQAAALAAALRAVKWILKQLYTEERVAVYRRNMPFHEARALFQRALVFVAYDNALVNTLFMPPHSSVIEIRTSSSSSSSSASADSVYPDGGRHLYRNLAVATGVRHYLVECPEEPVQEKTEAGAGGSAADDGTARWGEVGSGADGGGDGGAVLGVASWEEEEEEDGERGGGGSSVTLPRGSLACGVERLRTVLESVLHDAFASGNFDPNLLDRSGEGFRAKIPGSRVSRADMKEKFLRWQECVAAEGSWKFDPRPRRLPWEYKGFSNYCDKRHMAASPTAVVVSKADQIADSLMMLPPEERKVHQEEWDVRPQLKYVWDTEGKCGSWEAFDGRVLCDWARGRRWNGTGMPLTEEEEEEREEAAFKGEVVREKGDGSGGFVLIIGDSLQEQFVRTLINNMLTHVKKPATWAVEETIPKECSELIEPGHSRHTYCRDYRLHSNVCANLTVRFIRHDYLQISNTQIKFDRVPFARLSLLAGARVLIVNRGAHYRPDRHFISAVRSALRFLRNKLPDTLIIYRTTVQGHANCTEHDKPLLLPGPTDNLPFFWGKFHGQNELARRAVEEVGGVFMDVESMTVLRPDSHQGFIPELNHEDCLHYCIPGPEDLWAQMLQNTLLHLLPQPAAAAGSSR